MTAPATAPSAAPAALTLEAVAERFGVCGKTVVNTFVKKLGLRGMHFGRQWRFRLADVEAFEARYFVQHAENVG